MKKASYVEMLKEGGIGVIPTDTIYGVVGSALNKKTVERIYDIRNRNRRKPMIVLVGSYSDLKRFNVRLNTRIKKVLNRLWPGKVSIVLKCQNKKFAYLHRGTKTLAFRLPGKKSLRALIEKVGPLVAPSANPEGKSPAKTVRAAKRYFGKRVDFYLDGGRMAGKPSKLVALVGGESVVLRV